jgi:hypothetical protein
VLRLMGKEVKNAESDSSEWSFKFVETG